MNSSGFELPADFADNERGEGVPGLDGGIVEKATVLVADDSNTLRSVVEGVLTDNGYGVVTASDGVESVQQFYTSRPDLVILDLSMPKLSGYLVCRLIKEDWSASHVPIIILTSHDSGTDRFWSQQSGAELYLTKDFGPSDLVESVAKLLKDRRPSFMAPVSAPQHLSEASVLSRVCELLDRKLFESTLVNEVSRLGAQTSDFATTADAALDIIGNFLAYSIGAIALVDEALVVLRPVGSVSQAEVSSAVKQVGEAMRHGRSDDAVPDLTAVVVETAGAVVDDHEGRLQTFVSMPLRSAGHEIGLLRVGERPAECLRRIGVEYVADRRTSARRRHRQRAPLRTRRDCARDGGWFSSMITSSTALELVADLVAESTGFRLPSGVKGCLGDIVESRARASGLDVSAYVRTVSTARDSAELARIYDGVAVGQTEFFRGGMFFDVLADLIVPDLVANTCRGKLSAWSAGCSTGEETWSLAAVCAHALDCERIAVTGTDLSRPALATARRGHYESSSSSIPRRFARWFELVDAGCEPADDLRETVEFGLVNITRTSDTIESASYDLILLCNVMIYFSPDVVHSVIDEMHRILRPGGILCLGRAESLWGIEHRFDVVDFGSVFAYRRPLSERSIRPADDSRGLSGCPRAVGVSPSRRHVEPPSASTTERAQQMVSGEQIAAVEGMLIAGRLDDAERAAWSLVADASMLPEAHYVLGSVLERRGETDRALDASGRVVYLDRDFALAHFCRGGIFERRGARKRASGAYQAAARAMRVSHDGRYDVFLESMPAAVLSRLLDDRTNQR